MIPEKTNKVIAFEAKRAGPDGAISPEVLEMWARNVSRRADQLAEALGLVGATQVEIDWAGEKYYACRDGAGQWHAAIEHS